MMRRLRSVPIALAILVFPVLAAEPDGHLHLSAEWVEPAQGNTPSVVRLTIRSLVPVDDAILTVSAPLDIRLQPAKREFGVADDVFGRHSIRRGLSALRPTADLTFDFILVLSPRRSDVIEFIVEGRDSSGRSIRNAIGWAAGESSKVGVERLGAVEFPAVVLRPTEKR
jgi:hypothetical protein